MGYMPLETQHASWEALSQLSAGSGSVQVPPDVVPGDEVWIAILTNTATTGTITPPADYTTVSSDDLHAALGGMGFLGIYKHTYAAGDTVTPSFTIGSGNWCYISWLVRSDGSPSVNSNSSATSLSTASVSVPQFSVARSTDLRLCVIASVNLETVTPPTPAATDNNFAAIPFQKVASVDPTSVSGGLYLYYSMWEDPTGCDGGATTWTSSAANYFLSRAIVITDGTSTQGYTPATEAETDPMLYTIRCTGPDDGTKGLSAAAGVFGGGAHTL